MIFFQEEIGKQAAEIERLRWSCRRPAAR